jgi:DNA-binding MurR/RpiR family transcriptional regulator
MFGLSLYLHVQLNSLHPNVIHVKTGQSLIADTIVNVQPNDVLIVFDFRRYVKVNQRLTEVFRKIGGKVIAIADSPISPSAKSADVLFLVATKGVSIFDSYTAVYFFINSLLAEVIQCSGDIVRQKYEKLEEYYKQFDIFYGS